MIPPRGATPPQHTPPWYPLCIVDISDNCERISTKFSVISLLSRRRELGEKMFKCVTHSWGNLTPHSNIGDISANYEQTSTKFLVIILLTRRWALGEKNVKYVTPLEATPPLYSLVDIPGKNESHKERRIKTQNIYYVDLYQRRPWEVVILEGQGEGSNEEETKTRGGNGQSVIKFP